MAGPWGRRNGRTGRPDRSRSSRRVRYPAPDLVVVGLAWAGVDGLTFLRWVRGRNELRASAPLVVLVDPGDRMVRHAAFAFGALDVAERPEEFSDLVELLEHLMARWCSRSDASPQVTTTKT